MRVFISLCGEGLWHTSRMLALARGLKEAGHSSLLAGYGRSLAVLKENGERAIETFPEMRMVGTNGRFDLASSIISSSGTPLDIVRAYRLERAAIARFKADAVVSDSRLSTAMAGNFSGKPTFYVSNQTEFRFSSNAFRIRLPKLLEAHNPQYVRRLLAGRLPAETVRRIADLTLSAPYGFADEILVPDFRPPDSVCLPLISRDIDMRKKTFFTGPMNALCFGKPKPAAWDAGTGQRRVLITFGGQKFREGLAEEIARIAARLKGYSFLIAGILVKEDSDIGNVRLRRFLPDLRPHAAAADFLVIPGGHSSIMESVLLQKPAVVIPDAGQAEQESNAAEYRALGLGEAVHVGRLAGLGQALDRLARNERAHHAKLARLAREGTLAQNGALNAAKMIAEFAERIRY